MRALYAVLILFVLPLAFSYGILIYGKDLNVVDANAYADYVLARTALCIDTDCRTAWPAGISTILGVSPIVVSGSGDTRTIELNYDPSRGLAVENNALYVPIGQGLTYSSGAVDLNTAFTDARYVNVAGDWMTGNLDFNADATIPIGLYWRWSNDYARIYEENYTTTSSRLVVEVGDDPTDYLSLVHYLWSEGKKEVVAVRRDRVDVNAPLYVEGNIYESGSPLAEKYVPSSRRVDTLAPLTGGGALSSDLTLGLNVGAGLKVNAGALEMNVTSDISCPSGQALTLVNPATGNALCTPVDTNPDDDVTGSGSSPYVPYWTDSRTLGSTNIYYDSANGRVGIGTPSPAATLDVNGSAQFDKVYIKYMDGAYQYSLMIGGGILMKSYYLGDTNDAYITVMTTAGGIRFRNNVDGVAYARIGQPTWFAYNVGIGTEFPAEKLHVEGNAYASGYLKAGTGVCIGSDCRTSWPAGVQDVTGTAPIVVTGTATKNVSLKYNPTYFTTDADGNLALTSSYATGAAYDARFVNENQANSITSSMIVDGTINVEDINTTDFNAVYDARYINEGQTAGGDLSGTYPNPTVVRIRGYPVSTTAPATGQALVWNGSEWAPANVDTSTTNELQNVFSNVSDGSNVASADSTSDTLTISGGPGISVSVDPNTDTVTITNTGDTDASDDVAGSGTANYIPKWTGAQTLGDSAIYDASGKVGIGTTAPKYWLDVRHSGSYVFRIGAADGNDLTFDIAAGAGLANITAGAEWNGSTYVYTGTRGASRIELHDGTFLLYVGGTSGTAGAPVTWKTVMQGMSTGYAYFPNRVGVGTSTPDSKLHVIGGVCVEGSDSGCAAAAGEVRAQKFTDRDNTAYYVDPANTGTSVKVAGAISAGGQVSAGSLKSNVIYDASGKKRIEFDSSGNVIIYVG